MGWPGLDFTGGFRGVLNFPPSPAALLLNFPPRPENSKFLAGRISWHIIRKSSYRRTDFVTPYYFLLCYIELNLYDTVPRSLADRYPNVVGPVHFYLLPFFFIASPQYRIYLFGFISLPTFFLCPLFLLPSSPTPTMFYSIVRGGVGAVYMNIYVSGVVVV